jgi:hypothetical protein
MSLATICINVANDLGIDEPTRPLWGSKLPTAKRLIAQARRAAWSLHRRGLWANTVIEHEFTAAGASDHPLPPDFLRLINDTAWERSRYWAMRGALGAQAWQLYRSSIYGRATMWRRFRIHVPAGQAVGTPVSFSIDPNVSAEDHSSRFVFEYQSAWYIRRPDGTIAADWTGDDDTALRDEVMIELGTRWRMLRRMGLAYDEEKEEYEREVDKLVAFNGGTQTLNLVPAVKRDDFIGQYSLGAVPPVPAPALPPAIAARLAPYERPEWRDPEEPDDRPPPLRPQPGPRQHGTLIGSPLPPPAAPPPPVIRVGTGQPLRGITAPRQLPPGTLGF